MTLFRLQRVIWLVYWAAARTSCESRSNFSQKRTLDGSCRPNRPTETDFLRKRRADVRRAVVGSCATRADVLAGATAASTETWTATHAKKEARFLTNQARHIAQAAISGNVLRPAEKTEAVLTAAAAERVKRTANDHAHDLKAARVTAKLKPRGVVGDLWNLPVWISGSLQPADIAACRDKVRDPSRLIPSSERHASMVFVVPDVASLGYNTSIAVRMCGGVVVDARFYVSRGKAGVSVMYGAGNTTERLVYVTPAFRTSQLGLSTLVDACIRSEGSNMRLCSAITFVEYHEADVARPVRNRKPMSAICLASVAEKQSHGLANLNYAFDIHGYIGFLGEVVRSTTNLCGR